MEPSQPEEINHEGNRTVTMGKGIRKYGCLGFQRDEVGVCVHVMNISHVLDVLEYFKSEEVKIPVNTLKFHSDVCKEDVIVAGEMLKRKPEYAVIFAFAVDVQPEALQYADQLGVKIYSFDTCTQFYDQTKAFLQTIRPTSSLEHPAV